MHKPKWLKIKPPSEQFNHVKKIVKFSGLNTVCQEAHCPNISECWSGGTATFMVMGDTCTRGCRFCTVNKGMPNKLDKNEPKKLVNALSRLKIFDYIVITSVDRDDLPDQGAGHFAECIKEIKNHHSKIKVEVLIPDFTGNSNLIKKIVEANPDVIAHNIETVERLQKNVRDYRANYTQSLSVLETVKKFNNKIYTKTSIMLGLGEKDREVKQAMKDLRKINVDFITLGQYLRPSKKHLSVVEYVKPEKFKYFENVASSMGFLYCASGPLVRSSYRAGEFFQEVQ